MLTKITATKWLITKKKFYDIDPVTERISKASPQLIINVKFFIISDDSVAKKSYLHTEQFVYLPSCLPVCLSVHLSLLSACVWCVCEAEGGFVRVSAFPS